MQKIFRSIVNFLIIKVLYNWLRRIVEYLSQLQLLFGGMYIKNSRSHRTVQASKFGKFLFFYSLTYSLAEFYKMRREFGDVINNFLLHHFITL